MIQNFYSVGKYTTDEDEPKDENEATEKLKNQVAQRSQYTYSFKEFMTTKLMRGCCASCCKRRVAESKRVARFERHQKATERLQDELNFVKLIRNLRVSEFISRLLLKRSQRALV